MRHKTHWSWYGKSCEHITMEAQKFIETSDVVLVPKKTGKGKEYLIDLRLFILENLLKKKQVLSTSLICLQETLISKITLIG